MINPKIFKTLAAVVAMAFAGTASLMANPYEKGQAVAAFEAKDQHGQPYKFDPAATRFLLVSHDMDTGKKANGALTGLGADYLPAKKAVYLANIDGMPAVGRMFALPKMRKYAHRIILGDDAALIARFPVQAGKVTVLALKGGKVVSVRYWDPGAEGIDGYLK